MGWTVRGLNPGGGEIFRTCPERPGRDADPSPPSSAVGHERVELYLYFPYGLYGLYRALVLVQGCTLPYVTVLQNIAPGPMTQYHISKDLHFQNGSCMKCIFNFVLGSDNKLILVKSCMKADHKHCYRFCMNHFMC